MCVLFQYTSTISLSSSVFGSLQLPVVFDFLRSLPIRGSWRPLLRRDGCGIKTWRLEVLTFSYLKTTDFGGSHTKHNLDGVLWLCCLILKFLYESNQTLLVELRPSRQSFCNVSKVSFYYHRSSSIIITPIFENHDRWYRFGSMCHVVRGNRCQSEGYKVNGDQL